MIKHALVLFYSLFLAVGPVAAQVQDAAAGGGKGGPSGVTGMATGPGANASLGLPIASPGLVGPLSGGVSPVIALIEAAVTQPESLRTLAESPAPAAVYARALIAAAVTPVVRTEAVQALGEADVARLEAAVKILSSKTAGLDKVAVSLKNIAAEFAALDHRAPEVLAVAPAVASLKKPGRTLSIWKAWRTLKAASIITTMAVTLNIASPAIFAHSPRALPTFEQGVAMAKLDAGRTQGQIEYASDINDAIAKWTPSTKLIVIGNPGLDSGSQKQLAAWLAQKHWTVIIIESNSGMSYRDAEGRARYDNDAVEFGAGQGLYKKDGFGSQIDAASGLQDGSILVITMQQHKLYLRNSQAQRDNGLDAERHFAGNLDRWAVERMRAGGDVVGAVKDTVTNLDRLLNSAVAAAAQNAVAAVKNAKTSLDELARVAASFESAHPGVAVGAVDLSALRAQLAASETALADKDMAEASRLASGVAASAGRAISAMRGYDASYASAQAAIASVRGEVDALEKASSAFLKDHPKATGDLARPGVGAMREKLKSAESALSGNPSAAKSAADSVASEVRRVQAALTAHAAGADQIAASESILKQLESRRRAGAAAQVLVAAKQALREAREEHDLGASGWASELQRAKSALERAERAISAADVAARRNAMAAMIFQILLGLGTLGGGIVLNRRARRARGKAQAELQKWDEILETKLDAVIDELDQRMDVYVGPISGEKSRGWQEETAAAAEQVRRDAGRAKLYLAMARSIHDRATALVRPQALTPAWFLNYFWPSRYRKAESMLAHEPLTFKPEDGFDGIFDKKKDWRQDLYGEAKDYAPVSENFESVMAQFNETSKSAVAALDEIEKAATGYGAAFDKTAAAIAAAETTASEAASGAFFKLSALGAAILPRARETLDAARGKAAKNPVGAMKGQGALAERMAADALSLAEFALSMRQDELAKTDPIVAALASASVATQWILESRAALDEQASKLAASLQKTSGAQGLETLKASYAAHAANLSKAKNGLAAIAASRAAAVKSAAAIDAARAQAAGVLQLEAADMLRETDSDPTQRLAAAAEALAEASRQLGAGRLAQAEASQQQGAELIAQADAIVAASLKSLQEQDGVVARRISEAQRLDALLPERAEILKTIKRDFAASTLGLAAGDVSHPNANGTVSDNVDEAQAAIEAAKAKREKSVRSFRQAQVLEAASLLEQAQAHEEIAQFRLDEIAEKRARLDQAVSDNAAALEKLEAKSRAWKAEIPGDMRSMPETMKAYDAAVSALAEARAAADTKKGDPFKTSAAIAAVSARMDQVWVMVNNDRDAYAEVVRSLKAAQAQLDAAVRAAQDAEGDGITDSPAITAAYRDLDALDVAYKKAAASSQKEHAEWPVLDHEADRITNEAARVAATLKGELAAAARATDAISKAASKVREATNWTGSYGVSVPGSPGSGSLNSARSALNGGDYEGAIRYAESARGAAVSAIQTAEAEVSRRRRAEEEERRREEEARRRRQQEEDDRRRRSSQGWSNSGGGGGGWGGSRSGGGGGGWGGSRSGGGSSGW